ncbi:hypothetical protein MARINOS108_11130 [Marinoscillum sp. 108]|nr:hypothetical protein MARINOS108_11130 [Marinoscillum sp. 108]
MNRTKVVKSAASGKGKLTTVPNSTTSRKSISSNEQKPLESTTTSQRLIHGELALKYVKSQLVHSC